MKKLGPKKKLLLPQGWEKQRRTFMNRLFCYFNRDRATWMKFENLFHTARFQNGQYQLVGRKKLETILSLPHSFLMELNKHLKPNSTDVPENEKYLDSFYHFFDQCDGQPLLSVLKSLFKSTKARIPGFKLLVISFCYLK
jgi:hypothetical protein